MSVVSLRNVSLMSLDFFLFRGGIVVVLLQLQKWMHHILQKNCQSGSGKTLEFCSLKNFQFSKCFFFRVSSRILWNGRRYSWISYTWFLKKYITRRTSRVFFFFDGSFISQQVSIIDLRRIFVCHSIMCPQNLVRLTNKCDISGAAFIILLYLVIFSKTSTVFFVTVWKSSKYLIMFLLQKFGRKSLPMMRKSCWFYGNSVKKVFQIIFSMTNCDKGGDWTSRGFRVKPLLICAFV